MALDQPLAAPPPSGIGFPGSWLVRTGDVDADSRLRFDGIARYLEDLGWDNLQATFFVKTDPIWIVRRTVIDVIEPITWPDKVGLRRWCSGLSTRWTNMRVQIAGAKGGLIETEGFLINISETTGMPTRISDEGLAALMTQTEEHRLRWRSWLSEPAPPESKRDVPFHLRATDIDMFNHLNNAAYWQAIESLMLDHPTLLSVPHRAVIEYAAPVFAREEVTVRSRFDAGDPSGPALRVWFIVDGAVRTTARVSALPQQKSVQ